MLPTLAPVAVTAMGCVLPVLDCIAVALRFRAKHKVRRIGIDDWLVAVSLVGCPLTSGDIVC